MTELIVALDYDSAADARKMCRLMYNSGVRWFKIGPRLLMSYGVIYVCQKIIWTANLFLDLKVYDTADTVEAVVRRAADLGAAMITVHATPRMLEAAMRARGDRMKVLAVPTLTDNPDYGWEFAGPSQFDGIVCPAWSAKWYHDRYPGKIVVSPGIRFVRQTPTGLVTENPDDHVRPASPGEARDAGADYVVVGRPIIRAPDPAAAALVFAEELR